MAIKGRYRGIGEQVKLQKGLPGAGAPQPTPRIVLDRPTASNANQQLYVVVATMRMQAKAMVRDFDVLTPLLSTPVQILASVAILIAGHRVDLVGYALTFALLTTVGAITFGTCGELVSNDRSNQILELLVATPTDYAIILAARALVLSFFALFGFAEAWALVVLVFRLPIPIHHPGVLVVALVATALASTGTSLVTAALFSLVRTTRTIQNAVNGPFYLLGGVLVPVTVLPVWLQIVSPLIYFYWAANLLRASLSPAIPAHVFSQAVMLLVLGLAGGLLGALIMRRMLDHLRSEGTLGLA